MKTRKTVDRDVIVTRANEAIAFLAPSGTAEDRIKREAIFNFASSILLGGNSYRGFRYLNRPPEGTDPSAFLWDDSRVQLF